MFALVYDVWPGLQEWQAVTVTSDIGAGVSADVLSPEGSKSAKVGSSTMGDVGFGHIGDTVEPVGMGLSDFIAGSVS